MCKVQILTRCTHCSGQALIPIWEFTNDEGETSMRYGPCLYCEGSGNAAKWVSLSELAAMLKSTQCLHQHTSFKGGMRFSAGDVWDNITEVCDDCGANLDQQKSGDFIDDQP